MRRIPFGERFGGVCRQERTGMRQTIEKLVPGLVYEDILDILSRPLPWEEFNGKTVLITGANGFISYYLVLALLARNDLFSSGIRVVGLVRSLGNAENKYGEILDRDDLTLLVQDVCEEIVAEPADFIIHAASQASAWHFEHDPVGTMNANLTGTGQVLEFARKCQATVLLFSSLKVYGSFVGKPKKAIREEDCGQLDFTSYKNCYAIGKRAAETLCASYSHQYQVPVKIVRPSYIYGPAKMEDDRVWAQFLSNVVRRENIVLKSNGSAYRSYCYVSDTVAAVFTVLLKGEFLQPYNISSRESNITIRGLAKAALKAFPERKLTLSFARKEDEAEPDITKSAWEILDSERLCALGWEAHVGPVEGMRRAAAIMEISQGQ